MNESQLVAALEDALRKSANPEDAHTTDELTDMWGVTPRKVRTAIKALMKQGRVEVVEKEGVRMDGARCTKPAYRIKD